MPTDNKEIQLSAGCHNICAMTYPERQIKVPYSRSKHDFVMMMDNRLPPNE
jgi:hypothetical protein